MHLSQKLVFVLLATCFFACKKEKEPAIPATDPCEGLAIQSSPLKTNWTLAELFANVADQPFVYGNQVICSKWGGTYFHELIGINKQTGMQEWKVKVPGPFLAIYAKVQGNQMYWIDQYTRQFVSFDLDLHTFKTLWTPDSTAVFVSPEFQLVQGGALLEVVYEYNTDIKKVAVLEKIDFQQHTSTVLYQSDQFFNDYIREGFWGLQLTTNAAGDTLAVFINTMYIINFGNLSILQAINTKYKKVEHEFILPNASLYSDRSALVVKDGQACIGYNIEDGRGNILNFDLKKGIQTCSITTNALIGVQWAGGKIIAYDYYATYAFQADSGEKIWQNGGSMYNRVDANFFWFESDGRLFMVRNHQLVQLDLETGCTLKSQAIEYASQYNEVVTIQKDPLDNVIYIRLQEQMLALQL
jgi:outer membrane protein assembly factor BamB